MMAHPALAPLSLSMTEPSETAPSNEEKPATRSIPTETKKQLQIYVTKLDRKQNKHFPTGEFTRELQKLVEKCNLKRTQVLRQLKN